MHILIVSESIPSKRTPLLGIFALDQAKALAKMGVKVTLFAIDLRTLRRWRRLGVVKGTIGGVDWYSINIPVGTFNLWLRCKTGKLAIRYLFFKVFGKTKRPDVIHAHFTAMGVISSYLSELKNIPLVITEHSSSMNKPVISNKKIKIAKDGYLKAKAVIAVSKALSNSIIKHTGIKCRVIPNIIDMDIFSKTQKKEHTDFVIVSTSNLVPIKNTRLLIEAMKELSKELDNVKLYIIGDGILRKDLEEKVIQYGLCDKVLLLGLKHREEIANIYESCDCFAMVSDSETFGVAYVEAMAAGLPVIATKCGGPEDFVCEDNGILVERNNVTDLVKAIKGIYFKNITFSSSVIRNSVINNYSPEKIANELITIYKEIIK